MRSNQSTARRKPAPAPRTTGSVASIAAPRRRFPPLRQEERQVEVRGRPVAGGIAAVGREHGQRVDAHPLAEDGSVNVAEVGRLEAVVAAVLAVARVALAVELRRVDAWM